MERISTVMERQLEEDSVSNSLQGIARHSLSLITCLLIWRCRPHEPPKPPFNSPAHESTDRPSSRSSFLRNAPVPAQTDEDASVARMATDGISLFLQPRVCRAAPPGELIGVLAHEVMHPALHHDTRRGDRDPKRWNEACDYAINHCFSMLACSYRQNACLTNASGHERRADL